MFPFSISRKRLDRSFDNFQGRFYWYKVGLKLFDMYVPDLLRMRYGSKVITPPQQQQQKYKMWGRIAHHFLEQRLPEKAYLKYVKKTFIATLHMNISLLNCISFNNYIGNVM